MLGSVRALLTLGRCNTHPIPARRGIHELCDSGASAVLSACRCETLRRTVSAVNQIEVCSVPICKHSDDMERLVMMVVGGQEALQSDKKARPGLIRL